jgi:hypothetical protein
MPLHDLMAVENVQEQLKTGPEKAEEVARKWDAVLRWNPGHTCS